MLRAAMKEAAVREDHYPQRRDHHVRTPGQGPDVPVDPPSIAECGPYSLVQPLLGRSPGTADSRHVGASLFGSMVVRHRRLPRGPASQLLVCLRNELWARRAAERLCADPTFSAGACSAVQDGWILLSVFLALAIWVRTGLPVAGRAIRHRGKPGSCA